MMGCREDRMRIYLIDDEILIVESLTRLLQNHLGSSAAVRFFTDPVKLISAFREAPCDLLISDIRMPGMTGLELIRSLHEINEDFETIFLTGYDMFEYAYESIQENAFGYLLKNEADERILEKVDLALKKIRDQRAYANHLEQVRQDLDALRAEYRKQTLRDILMWEGAEMLPDLLDGRRLYILLGFIIDYEEQAQIREIVLQMMADGLASAPALRVNWQTRFMVRHDLIWLFSSEKDHLSKEEIYHVLCGQQKLLETYVSRSLLLVMDYEPADAAELYDRYLRSKKVKMYNLLMQKSGVASANQETLPAWQGESLRALQQIPDRLFTLLEDGLPAGIAGMMEPLYAFWENHRADQEALALQLYLNFAAGLLSFVRQQEMAASFPPAELDALLFIRMPMRFETRIPLIRAVLDQLIAACTENERSRLQRVSAQVKEFIVEHISDDLSASTIAASVGYSEAHLSRLFKESEGLTLHNYIQQARITQACRMLRDTNEKIYRIAQMSGYNNTAYFIRVFKGAIGITPQEYRDGRSAGV